MPGWTGTGDFVGITPSKETLSGQLGSGVLDTCQAGCDAGRRHDHLTRVHHRPSTTSTYSSRGGNHPLDGAMPTAVAVLVNGNVVASVTGNNSASLNWQAIDLSAYQGQQAQLQIIDRSDGSNGWGHLIVDNPVLSDAKAVGWANQTGANLHRQRPGRPLRDRQQQPRPRLGELERERPAGPAGAGADRRPEQRRRLGPHHRRQLRRRLTPPRPPPSSARTGSTTAPTTTPRSPSTTCPAASAS